MIHLPRACRGRTAERFPANSSCMCFVELALNRLLFTYLGSKGFLSRGFSPLINGTAIGWFRFWRRRAQIKQLEWPIEERQIDHRKSRLVLSTRFPVVDWRFFSVPNWGVHCDYIIKEANRRLYALRTLKKCGEPTSDLITVYCPLPRLYSRICQSICLMRWREFKTAPLG